MIARFIIHHLWLIDLLCLLVIPLLILCFGWFFSRRRHTKRPLVIGLTLALIAAATFCYGRFFETQQLEVRHVELTFSDLPAEFDGYRLVRPDAPKANREDRVCDAPSDRLDSLHDPLYDS